MEKTQPYYKTTQQYSLNYKNTFNDLHDVEALALWEWKETNTNWFMARRYYSTTSAIPELDRGDVDNMYNEGNSAVYKYGGLEGRLSSVFVMMALIRRLRINVGDFSLPYLLAGVFLKSNL